MGRRGSDMPDAYPCRGCKWKNCDYCSKFDEIEEAESNPSSRYDR